MKKNKGKKDKKTKTTESSKKVTTSTDSDTNSDPSTLQQKDIIPQKIELAQTTETESLKKTVLSEEPSLDDFSSAISHIFEVNQVSQKDDLPIELNFSESFPEKTISQESFGSEELNSPKPLVKDVFSAIPSESTFSKVDLEVINKENAEVFFSTKQIKENTLIDSQSLHDAPDLDNIPEIFDEDVSLEPKKTRLEQNEDLQKSSIINDNSDIYTETDIKSTYKKTEMVNNPGVLNREPLIEPSIELPKQKNNVIKSTNIEESNIDLGIESKVSPVGAESNFSSSLAPPLGAESSFSSTLAPPLAPEVFTKFELIDGALILDVKPGIALGSFYLGQTFNAVVANLNYNSMLIPTVDFTHDPKVPLSKDYALHLRNNGLVLYFDSSLQVLKEVVVHDLSRVRISYRGVICSSNEKKLTSARVHQLLGPTYPGHFNKARDQYILDYPGLSFYFHVPAQSTEHQLVQEAPLELPGTSAPICHRICVYIHRPHSSNGAVSSSSSDTSLETGFLSSVLSSCISRAKVIPTIGIYLLSRVRERPKNSVWIRLGITTTQDVMADLGPPGKVFYKDDNKMDIHRIQSSNQNNSTSWSSSVPIPSPSGSPVSQTPYGSLEERHPVLLPTDYFYNYFDQGIDILFDGYTHCVKKIILHTNIPSHFDFNVYRKCHFEFLSENLNAKEIQEDTLNAWPPTASSITSDTLMSVIKESWGSPIGRPVVYDRSYGQYHNPFHPTTLQGYPGNLILEVLDNEHLASVTLF